MPPQKEPPQTAPDPRAELERLRKLKRLRELQAKAAGQPLPSGPKPDITPLGGVGEFDPKAFAGLNVVRSKPLPAPNAPNPIVTAQRESQQQVMTDWAGQQRDARQAAAAAEAQRKVDQREADAAFGGMDGLPMRVLDDGTVGPKPQRDAGVRGTVNVLNTPSETGNFLLELGDAGMKSLYDSGFWGQPIPKPAAKPDYEPRATFGDRGLGNGPAPPPPPKPEQFSFPKLPLDDPQNDAEMVGDVAGKFTGAVLMPGGVYGASEKVAAGIGKALAPTLAKASPIVQQTAGYGGRLGLLGARGAYDAGRIGGIMGEDGSKVQTAYDWAADPLNWAIEPLGSIIYRASIFLKTGGKQVTPNRVQLEGAMNTLQRADASPDQLRAAVETINRITPPPSAAPEVAPTPPYPRPDLEVAQARPTVAPTPEQAASATPPYPRPDMDPVPPETVTAPPAPVESVGPPKRFSASPEPRGRGVMTRNADRIVGGAVGAWTGGAYDAFAAGADGNENRGFDIINPISGGVAGMLVPRFLGQGWRAGRRAVMPPTKRSAYDARIAYNVLRKQLERAGMRTPEEVVAAKEASFGGINASLLDITQEGVNTATNLSRLPGTTPGTMRNRAEELIENRPGRVERYIEETTGLSTAAVSGDVQKLADEAMENASPAYKALREGYPFGSINSQRLEQIEGLAPHIQAVDEYRLFVAANEGRVVGDFEYWDLVKRDIDAKEQQLIDKFGATMDDIRVQKLESARSALVAELDNLVKGYSAARELGGEAPKIREAFAEGQTYFGGRYSGDEVLEKISKWNGVPLTAAQSGVVRIILGKAKSGGAAVSALSSARAKEQLAAVFGKAKTDDLQAFLAADAAIVQNASRTNPNVGSATGQVMLGAGEGMIPAAAEAIRAARNPVEAVLGRMSQSGAYSQAQRDIMGEMLAKGVTAENLAPIFAGRRPRGGGRPRGGAGPTAPQGPPTAGGAGPAAGAAAGPPPRAAAAAATQQPRPAPSQEAVLAAMAQVTQPGPGRARGPMGPPARETIWDGPIPTKPQSLRAWIRSQGGIDDTNYMTGDVAAIMGRSNGMPGLINRKDGTGLDELTRKASQEGFDVDPEDASTLMRLIEEEFAGNPSYRIGAKEEWDTYQDTLRARRGEGPDQNSLGAFPGAGNAAAAASGVGGAAYGYYNPQDANEDGVIDDSDRQMTAMGMGFGGLVSAGLVRGAMGNRQKGPPGVQSNSFGGGSDRGPPAYNPRQEAANIRDSIGTRAASIIEKLPERAKGREMVEALAAEGVSMYKNEQKAFFRRFPQDKPATRKQVAAFMDDVASGKTFDGQLPAGRPVPPSIDEVTNLKAAQSLAAERPFGTNRELKVALDKRFRDRAKAARVDLSEDTKATREYIARVALADAIEAIRTNANAIGWYDDKVTKAMSVMEEVHPELATDVNARFAFTVALAITSNGQKVGKNFELAEQAYQVFKNTGRMPTNISAGEAQKAINSSLNLFNGLLNKHGIDKLRDIITTKRTVKEIEDLTGIKIDERVDEEVFGAGIFGPKIGNGFLMNLHGEFGQLTIDRWFMRTWGRWTGNLIEKNKEMMDTKRGHLSGLIEMMDPSDKRAFEAIIGRRLSVSSIDDVAHAIRKASQDPALRDQMAAIGGLGHNSRPMVDELLGPPAKGKQRHSLGDELRKNGNALWKYLDGQIEQPSGPPQRRQIREVLTTVLDALKKDYPNLTMADLQALLWYPEKRLYDGAKLADTVQVAEASTGKGARKAAKEGYTDVEAPDYLNAAIQHAEKLGITRDKIDAATRRGQSRIDARRRSGSLGSNDGRSGQGRELETKPVANQVPVAPFQGPPTKAKSSATIKGAPKLKRPKPEAPSQGGAKSAPAKMGFGGKPPAGEQYDFKHLDAIKDRLAREQGRLGEATTAKEREFRAVRVSQAEKELANEIEFLKSKSITPPDEMSIDDLAAELEGFDASPTQNGLPGGSRDLPMDERSRMERRKAWQAEKGPVDDTVLYHGTASDFDEFRISEDGNFGPGVYLTRNPQVASQYAAKASGPSGKNVRPVYVRGKLATSDNYDDVFVDVAERFPEETNDQLNVRAVTILKKRGYAGIDGDGQISVFDPSNIRGKFAKFDPSESGSSKLLASFPGAGNAAAAASGVGGAAYGWYNPQDANEDGIIDDSDRQMTSMGMGFGGLVTAGVARSAMNKGPKGPPGVLSNTFGGLRAANALAAKGEKRPQRAIGMAIDMAYDGASRDEIWDATSKYLEGSPYKGAVAGKHTPDGEPRFEIDDSGAKLTGAKSGRLGDVMEHPELYNAYPDLADVQTVVAGRGGAYIPPTNYNDETIRVGARDTRSLVLHEAAGHGVQQRERNFATGGNPNDVAASLAKRNYEMLARRSDEIFAQPNVIAANKRYNELKNTWQGRSDIPPDVVDELKAIQAMPEKKELARIKAEAAAMLRKSETWGPDSLFTKDELFDGYRRLAGETEARNVQTRDAMRMRGEKPGRPWETQDVPDDQQIVRFGSGKAESRPKPPGLDDSAGGGQSGGMLSEELKRAKTQRMALRQRLSQIFEDLGEDVEVAKAASPRDLQRLAEDIRYDLSEESYQELRNEIQNLDDIETGIQDILHSRRHEQRMRSALRGKGADDLAALTRMASGAEPLQEGVTDLTASQIRRSAQAGFGPSKQQKGPPKAR